MALKSNEIKLFELECFICKHYEIFTTTMFIFTLCLTIFAAIAPVGLLAKVARLNFFDIRFYPDKIAHTIGFIWISLVVDATWYKTELHAKKISALLAYGVLLELIQFLTEYRHPSINDIIANSFGILCYVLIIPIIKKLPFFRIRWIYKK
jgi:glycopeptide antibiotics resistance protein